MDESFKKTFYILSSAADIDRAAVLFLIQLYIPTYLHSWCVAENLR